MKDTIAPELVRARIGAIGDVETIEKD